MLISGPCFGGLVRSPMTSTRMLGGSWASISRVIRTLSEVRVAYHTHNPTFTTHEPPSEGVEFLLGLRVQGLGVKGLGVP